jgi:hypothetical protein
MKLFITCALREGRAADAHRSHRSATIPAYETDQAGMLREGKREADVMAGRVREGKPLSG